MFKKQHVVSVLDVSQFLQLLTDAVYEEEHCERLHAACDRVEEFLSKAGTEIRDMLAIEMFESFQNAEYPYSGDTFLENVRQAGFAGSDGVGRRNIDFAHCPAKSHC